MPKGKQDTNRRKTVKRKEKWTNNEFVMGRVCYSCYKPGDSDVRH